MISFKRFNYNSVFFGIDTKIFNECVISKTLYWLSGDFIVYLEGSGNKLKVKLEKKEGDINNEELILLKTRINQDLIDFKVRDIVNHETKNIREILLVKAFANNDDFEDYNLIANKD